MQKIIVQGGGLAGRTFARSLSAKNNNFQIIVLDSKEHSEHISDRGIGLWPNAINALHAINLHLHGHTYQNAPAAYRNNDGIWLSKCSKAVAENIPVYTFQENTLLKLLEQTKDSNEIEYKYNATVNTISENIDQDGIIVTLDNGETIQGDLCVVASGSQQSSTWYDSVSGIVMSPMSISNKENITQSTTTTMQEPYVTAFSNSICDTPSETLISKGSRIAVVPLSPGSFFWFVSYPKNENIQDIQSELNTIETLQTHLPMKEIIQASDPSSLVIRRTYLKDQHTESLSSKYSKSARIILIGDAAHSMPNNLAQGGSVAIEDGYLLGQMMEIDNIANVKQLFATKRKARILKCQQMNLATQIISDYPNVANLMQYVPMAINSFIFDVALKYSLGGGKELERVVEKL